MNYEIAMKITLLLAGLLSGSMAWAEGKAKSSVGNSGAACTIENRDHSGYSPPQVIEFGELKIKSVEEGGQAGSTHYAVFDLKAPQYLKRSLRLKEGEIFTDTICGNEVSIQMRGWSVLRVSSF
jgi:hypothetical protein